MKYIIPYVSKVANPRSGRYDYQYHGKSQITLKTKELFEHPNWQLTSFFNGLLYGKLNEYTYIYCGDIGKADYLSLNLESYQVLSDANIETIDCLTPEPEYLYKYGDFEIKCDECNEKFSYKKLKHFEIDYGNDYSYSDCVCPICNKWDCCIIEFEK